VVSAFGSFVLFICCFTFSICAKKEDSLHTPKGYTAICVEEAIGAPSLVISSCFSYGTAVIIRTITILKKLKTTTHYDTVK
jgi:hypothetical protein